MPANPPPKFWTINPGRNQNGPFVAIPERHKPKGRFIYLYQDALSWISMQEAISSTGLLVFAFIVSCLDYGNYLYATADFVAKKLKISPSCCLKALKTFSCCRKDCPETSHLHLKFTCRPPYDYFRAEPVLKLSRRGRYPYGNINPYKLNILMGFKLELGAYNRKIRELLRMQRLKGLDLDLEPVKIDSHQVDIPGKGKVELIMLPKKKSIFGRSRLYVRVFQQPLYDFLTDRPKGQLGKNTLRVLFYALARIEVVSMEQGRNIIPIVKKLAAAALKIPATRVSQAFQQLEELSLLKKDKYENTYLPNPHYFWLGCEEFRLKAMQSFPLELNIYKLSHYPHRYTGCRVATTGKIVDLDPMPALAPKDSSIPFFLKIVDGIVDGQADFVWVHPPEHMTCQKTMAAIGSASNRYRITGDLRLKKNAGQQHVIIYSDEITLQESK